MDFSPVIHLFERDPRILAVYALGSVVRGGFNAHSDVDLAVLLTSGERLTSVSLIALATQFTEALGFPVDVGLLSPANLVYTREALLLGQCIYRRPFGNISVLLASWLGLYTSYQYDRQEVLNAYTAG